MATSARARLSTFAVLAASAATVAGLLALRPHLAGSPASWSGDDLAYATTWAVAVAGAAWLTLIALACLAAMTRGDHAIAAHVARWGPPVARRILQAAVLSTWAIIPGTAYATPSTPLVVHVGPGGRLTTLSESTPTGAPAAADTPVVRTPPVAPAPASRVVAPTTAAVSGAGPAVPAPTVREPAAPRTAPAHHRYAVRPGDNLWNIARTEIARRGGVDEPNDRAVAEYWKQLIAVNRPTLRSGNPGLIFPGEIVALP